jgi:Uma2 family endonuclease
MIANLEPQYFTPEEYLEWEECQEFKYEYVNGEVYAMTGGTLSHNAIAVNCTTTKLVPLSLVPSFIPMLR